MAFYILVGIFFILSFGPFLSEELISDYIHTTGLWFQKFEFNASIYYLLRWVGFLVKGYNIIGTLGLILGSLVFAGILLIAGFLWKRKKTLNHVGETTIFSGLLAGICLYYFLATTVHPWYLALPLILSIFTRFRFALVWSILVVSSYSAYSSMPATENPWLLTAEYLIVYGYLIYEVFLRKSPITT